MGLIATIISTSQGDRSIHVPIGNEVELWVELRGTTREARIYYIIVRSTLRSRGKLYLLPLEVRCRKIRAKRQHQLPQQHRKGCGHPSGSLSTPVEDAPPVATQCPSQFTTLILVQFSNPMIDADVCTATNDDIDAVVDNNVDA
ncbi:hypothetical protein Gotur_030066 [Gossypium turneri]